jgi:hypothetical protein
MQESLTTPSSLLSRLIPDVRSFRRHPLDSVAMVESPVRRMLLLSERAEACTAPFPPNLIDLPGRLVGRTQPKNSRATQNRPSRDLEP